MRRLAARAPARPLWRHSVRPLRRALHPRLSELAKIWYGVSSFGRALLPVARGGEPWRLEHNEEDWQFMRTEPELRWIALVAQPQAHQRCLRSCRCAFDEESVLRATLAVAARRQRPQLVAWLARRWPRCFGALDLLWICADRLTAVRMFRRLVRMRRLSDTDPAATFAHTYDCVALILARYPWIAARI